MPSAFTTTPEIHGRVIAPDGHPLAGATVEVREFRGRELGTVAASLTSGPDGAFQQAEKSSWHLWILGQDFFFPNYAAQASADGRTSERRSLTKSATSVRPFGLGPTGVADFGDLVVSTRATSEPIRP
jgi:hypothetical protein